MYIWIIISYSFSSLFFTSPRHEIATYHLRISYIRIIRTIKSALNSPYIDIKGQWKFQRARRRADRKICVAHGSGFHFPWAEVQSNWFYEWYRLHGDRSYAACQDSHRISYVFYHRVRWRARASRISGPIFDYLRE